MRVLHLYRPALPGVRAQTVQVIHTCDALARRGHRVTLLADRAGDGDAAAQLATFGLTPAPGFDLRLAPVEWRPGASLWFRAQVRAWAAEGPGLVYAREKKYVALVPAHVPVVIEAHEAEVPIAEEAGGDVAGARALEAAAFGRAAGVVTNCGGTLRALEASVPALPTRRRVIHNATRGDRAVTSRPDPGPIVGYTGSPKLYKGLQTVFGSLERWPAGARLRMVGGAPPETPPAVEVRPAVAYGALPAELARCAALLLPLDDNLFGRSLTSPLKLWDYLATGIPIVAADLPTVREIAGDRPHYYRPGDPVGLADAVARALAAGTSPPLVRTWDDRARDVEAFLDEVLTATGAPGA